jgi:hypothetical protein
MDMKINMKINKDIKSYIRDLTELVWAYIRHRAAYPANALLAVQRELACNVFDSPDNCRGCDFYAPEMLLTYNEKGAMVPNHSVIKSIAKRYY